MDRDVVDFDAAFDQELLDVSVGESVSEVPADSQHDHFGWETVACER